MSALAYKLRLILAGILVSLAVGAIAQVGGGSGTSAPVLDAANLPKLDTANTFSADQTITGTSAVGFVISDTDAAADEKRWKLRTDAGRFFLSTETDAGVATVNPLFINRTGTNVDSLAMTADSITANGDAIMTGGWAQVSQAGIKNGSGGMVVATARTGVGDYNIDITGATSFTSYACVASVGAGGFIATTTMFSSTRAIVHTFDAAGVADDASFSVICTGN